MVTCDLLCTTVLPSPESTIRASEVANQASGASGGGRAQLLGRSTSHARAVPLSTPREKSRARVQRRPPAAPGLCSAPPLSYGTLSLSEHRSS